VLAGDDRERVLQVALKLDTELGLAVPDAAWKPPPEAALPRREAFAEMMGADDEHLVREIRDALTRVAAAVSFASGNSRPPNPGAVYSAINGAEIVMRGEIVSGRAELVPELIPGFVFLATLPVVGQAEALRLSDRTAELLEKQGE
jgi:hypothetical protein